MSSFSFDSAKRALLYRGAVCRERAGLNLRFFNKPVFVSAGMQRSGSTLLFNMLRLILSHRWEKLSSCWVGDIAELPAGDAFLIKVHSLSPYWNRRAQNMFYTYRDVRVAMVSAMKTMKAPLTMEVIAGRIRQYELAKERADLMIKYEVLLESPETIVSRISQILNIPVDSEEIARQAVSLRDETVPGSKSGYSKETLFHKGHCTYTANDEWRTVFPRELQDQVHEQFSWWFRECGYSLD